MKKIADVLGFVPTLYIDDGHGMETAGKRTPALPGVGVVKENEFNRPVANKLQKKAEEIGFRVVQSAPEIEDIPLKDRSARINADFATLSKEIPWNERAIGISIHYNAYNGVLDNKRGGVEVYHHATSEYGKKFATIALEYLLHGYEQVNRGVKNNNLHMTRETHPVFILVECGFMDQLDEALKMRSEAFQEEEAEELLQAACKYYGQDLEKLRAEEEHAILQEPTATIGQCQAWAKAKGATQEFIDLAPIFFKVAKEVDPVGAFAQSAKETGFGRFGGVIDASYKNPCGMKKSSGGGNYDPEAHQRFNSWEEGITAHVDHLALYAGQIGYPLKETPDPRHFAWIKGKAPTWEQLGGKWAPSKTYGESIVAMMKQIQETKAPEENNDMLRAEVEKLSEELDKMEQELNKAYEIIEAVHDMTK